MLNFSKDNDVFWQLSTFKNESIVHFIYVDPLSYLAFPKKSVLLEL